MPLSKISSFCLFVCLLNVGTSCCTELNNFDLSSVYRKHEIKKCSTLSTLSQRQAEVSDKPIVNLCKFRSDLPTLKWVCSLLPTFVPLGKSLIFWGLSLIFNFSLNKYLSILVCKELFRLFEDFVKCGKYESENYYL